MTTQTGHNRIHEKENSDLTLVPVFDEEVYKLLADYSTEFLVDQQTFLLQAINREAARLRKAAWWSELSEDERKSRAANARKSRWPSATSGNLIAR